MIAISKAAASALMNSRRAKCFRRSIRRWLRRSFEPDNEARNDHLSGRPGRWRCAAKAGMDCARARPGPGPSETMIKLTNFTPRMGLILAHDLIATAVAIVASFYIRFEGQGISDRWPLLIIVVPAFVAYSETPGRLHAHQFLINKGPAGTSNKRVL